MPASYSIVELPTATTPPLPGLVSCPSSCTESPSGSMPSSGMSMVTLSPAMTRAVTVVGTGGWLVSAFGSRTSMLTCACAVWPSGPTISYTAVKFPVVDGAR